MKKLLLNFLYIFCTVGAFAQNEYLAPMGYNPKLYQHIEKSAHKKQLKAGIITDSNALYYYDTLSLPFFDEFSTNKTRPLSNNGFTQIGTKFLIGKCVTNLSLNASSTSFMLNQSWRYEYNLGTNQVDSFPLSAIQLYQLTDTINCTDIIPASLWYPTYYRYTFNSSGVKTDSVLVKPDTTLKVATIKEYRVTNVLWADNYAYVNNHFPVAPPSIGVATLDGLNEYGIAYNNSTTNMYGIADYLTSMPLNLQPLSYKDSVYISFLYQPTGLGDNPDDIDSLILELKDNQGNWNRVWSTGGADSLVNYPAPAFKQVLYKLPQYVFGFVPQYFYKGFQFRFLNYATLNGANDHWHIDYVRIDTARKYTDTLIKDVAFLYDVPSILKEYTQKPTKHFNPATDIDTTLDVTIRNNDCAVAAFNAYKITTGEIKNGNTSYYASNNIPFQTFCAVVLNQNPASDFNIPSLSSFDSAIVKTTYSIAPSDICKTNDSTFGYQLFQNELAYDDGSAERAYGLQGNGTKKFAYEFNISKPDTLAAVLVHFTTNSEDVSNLIFNIEIWKKIGLNGSSEVLLKEIVNRKPTYINRRNGFAVFALDTAIIVDGTFYVGWAQADLRNLQIGYDKNSTKGHSKMYVYAQGSWAPTSITQKGSPMIRVILDGDFKYNTAIENRTKKIDAIAFPNPCSNQITVQSNTSVKQIMVFDILGKQLINTTNTTLNVSELSEGFYLLKIIGENASEKTIKIRKIAE